MLIKFSESQMEQALRLYAMMALGVPASDVEGLSVIYEAGSYRFSCNVKNPSIPYPKIKKQEISQEEVDKVYSVVAKRSLDVS
jgi:hypothetical protein